MQQRDRRQSDTRQRILDAALALFGSRGASNTSLRNIADELGITKAALYYHFPSKAELIRSLYQPFMDQTDAFLDDAEERMLAPRELLTAYFDSLVTFRAQYLTLLRDASVLAHVDLEAASVRWVERFQRLLTGPNATPEERVRAVVAVGGLARTIVITDVPNDRLRAAAVDAAVAALAGTPTA